MIDILLVLIGLTGLIIGSVTDLKTREVPDWLNYSLIASGLGLRLLYSIFSSEWSYFLYGLLGFALFFGLACLMFYAGQWGGGDSKMLMGLGALFGTYPEFLFGIFKPVLDYGTLTNHLTFLLAFLINLLFVGGLYGFVWSLILSIKHRKAFVKEFKSRMDDKRVTFVRRAIMMICILLMVIAFFIKIKMFVVFILIMVFISMLTFYVWVYVKSVENVCMYKTVPATKLTEGDWIASAVMLHGKKVYDENHTGIEKKDIEKLVKLNVKEVLVKEGIPFVPSFLITFIVSVIFGNVLFLIAGMY
jgi:prepilin signal peptidase PulO-like enzyme (type II secretory pathway)